MAFVSLGKLKSIFACCHWANEKVEITTNDNKAIIFFIVYGLFYNIKNI
jgi:hypothetical protein